MNAFKLFFDELLFDLKNSFYLFKNRTTRDWIGVALILGAMIISAVSAYPILESRLDSSSTFVVILLLTSFIAPYFSSLIITTLLLFGSLGPVNEEGVSLIVSVIPLALMIGGYYLLSKSFHDFIRHMVCAYRPVLMGFWVFTVFLMPIYIVLIVIMLFTNSMDDGIFMAFLIILLSVYGSPHIIDWSRQANGEAVRGMADLRKTIYKCLAGVLKSFLGAIFRR